MSDQEPRMWLWKDEPSSPTETTSIDIDEDWLNVDSKHGDIKPHMEPVMYEENASRAQVATKLLKELDEWIKEEPFSDWLEEKIDLPIFEELSPAECGANQPSAVELKPQDTTQTLLQEFESVLGDVEACHLAGNSALALTPPQSPPAKYCEGPTNARILVTLQPVYNTINDPLSKPLTSLDLPQGIETISVPVQWSAENVSLEPLGDVASELAVVDELVRSCTEDIDPPSPSTCSDAGSGSSEDSNDDPEWRPDVTTDPPKSSTAKTTRVVKSTGAGGTSTKSSRAKPYARPAVEEKKVRKKEQNKNAATRYRQKKKAEIKEILGEEQELVESNEKLQYQVNDLQREIRYLKGLMRDLFKAKGLIK